MMDLEIEPQFWTVGVGFFPDGFEFYFGPLVVGVSR